MGHTINRATWYAERAEWHGKMAVYCINTALKPDNLSSDWNFEGFLRDAVTHTREAWHFAIEASFPDLHHIMIDSLRYKHLRGTP